MKVPTMKLPVPVRTLYAYPVGSEIISRIQIQLLKLLY